MKIKTILPVLLVLTLAAYLVARYNGPEKDVLASVDKTSLEKYWKVRNAGPGYNLVSLVSKDASVTSRFRIRDFELSLRMRTTGGATGQLNFATTKSFDSHFFRGYSVMINNGDYGTGPAQKTGSLSRIRNYFVKMAEDGKPFDLSVVVNGNRIRVSVDGKVVTEYQEPANARRLEGLSGMVLSRSFIALRKTNDTGEIVVEEMKFKPLSESEAGVTTSANPDPVAEAIDSLNQREFPMIDYHVHLKGGLTMDQACSHARDNGFCYGVAANCGLKFPVTNDSTLYAYVNSIRKEPVFKAMQCEGREWVTLFSPAAVSEFDYIFTDAMTWTDHRGRRLRLWMPAETFVDEEQQFMDMLVGKIESIMDNEPVDIYVNPSFIPAQLQPKYDELWTSDRMDRVVNALLRNQVALEINCRYKIPSIPFIKKAKAAGVKFTFGTNNTLNNDLNRLEYGIRVVKEVGLTREDMFVPRPKSEKKILKKGLPAKITG